MQLNNKKVKGLVYQSCRCRALFPQYLNTFKSK